MRQFAVFLAVGLLLVVLPENIRAAAPAKPPSAAQLQAWLAQLDDEDFARREAATEQLHAAGDAAIEVLARGALSGSPEAAWRAGEALKRIALSGSERTLDCVAQALEKVGRQGRQGMHQVVAEIRARQKQIKHDRAAAQIRQFGGGLVGGGDGRLVDFGFMPVGVPIMIDVAPVDAVADVAPMIEVAPLEAAADGARVEEAKADLAEVIKESVEKAKLPEPPAAKLRDAIKEIFADDKPAETQQPVSPAKRADDVKITDSKDGIVIGSFDEALEPADDLEVFRELERGPLAPAADPVAAAAADIDVAFAPIAVGGFGGGLIFGGGFVEVDEEDGARTESLSLDAHWRGGDQGLAALADLPDVSSVSIQGAKLTDAALKHLAALPKLGHLSIQGTRFSAVALRDLHRANPNAYLFCQGDAMVGIHADTTGACVLTSVYPGSGAAAAGLQAGDKIITMDGLDVRDFSELTISVYARNVGDKLKIEYERNGKRQTADVELRSRRVLER